MKNILQILMLLLISNFVIAQQLHVEGEIKVETVLPSTNSAKVLMHENDQRVTQLPISAFDTSDQNEIQLLSINGDTLFISDGNFLILPGLSYLSTLIPVPTISVQTRLDDGETPCEIIDSGIIIDSLYGKNFMGGLIFHLDLITCESLIALAFDLNQEQWGCKGVDITGANGQNIGDGFNNTISIFSNCSDPTYAAKTSWDLNNGFSDWYLPSLNELLEVYDKLHTQNYGAYANAAHWSSSQNPTSPNKAFNVYFENGNWNSVVDKDVQRFFLPIRKE